MHSSHKVTDANEACASVAYRLSENIAIYPITPSSPMAESCDEWAAKGKKNIWGFAPDIAEMQSEAGVAGAVHGALTTGSLTTTFTASQGLLLMIPNMYKIAGELTPFTMHVTARALATHALSIFGDQSDVMACRQTGFAMLCSNTAQEAHDLAAIAHAASLETRVPFMHFFDGFRTSHEVNTYEELSDKQLQDLIDPLALEQFRNRASTPDSPVLRGTAQNPDVYFQAREAVNAFYSTLPEKLSAVMAKFARITGRPYGLVEYEGHPQATEVVVAMGSACETLAATSIYLNSKGAKTGVVKVRLFRPFSVEALLMALPQSVKRVAVLDRTKEPGSLGEPLYQDVVTACATHGRAVAICGGRYGLASKEFTPAMAAGVFAALAAGSLNHNFTVGINDDVTHLSIPYDEGFHLPKEPSLFEALFYGLGSDGTVGANKNSIKIIGDETGMNAQAYFVYDSRKAGSMTTSHLRFGKLPIRAPYLISQAPFVAVHNFQFLERLDLLKNAAPGAVVLVNSLYAPEKLWDHLPRMAQRQILEKKLKLYTIDAFAVAKASGMGGRINTIMQTCFFAISGVLPKEQAIAAIKKAIEKTYARKGADVVQKNFKAVDATLEHLHEVKVGTSVTSTDEGVQFGDETPDFVKKVTAVMLGEEGDRLPVSAFPVDGAWPTGTTRFEKRNIALQLPQWDEKLCIQCGKCVFVCPHSAIRAKFYEPSALEGAPQSFTSVDFKSKDFVGKRFTIQVAPEDCTGCSLCSQVCPAADKANPKHKSLDMVPHEAIVEREKKNWDFFQKLPLPRREELGVEVKATQFKEPLFEFSGACAGCGETPYIRLLTQLYGDRLYMANATGCSSIYGGNLPTTPYTRNAQGRGPAWANSLFEDNAEFGYGIRLALDKKIAMATELLMELSPKLGDARVKVLLEADQSTDAGISAQRERVIELKVALRALKKEAPKAGLLEGLADELVKKSLWIVGGDGWAYDIGFGGLDHVLSQGRKVNILVLDTEVYSNTGGQQSKSTPLGAIAKFAASGKGVGKKDLGLMMMGYGNVYVASIAFGAKDSQTLQVLQEAENFSGPSLVIAYSHCVAHGFDLSCGLDHQKLAVETGSWLLYRYDPRRSPTLKLDSPKPKRPIEEALMAEARFKALKAENPERAAKLAALAQSFVDARYEKYARMAEAAAQSPSACPSR